jgi:hypothetical protein
MDKISIKIMTGFLFAGIFCSAVFSNEANNKIAIDKYLPSTVNNLRKALQDDSYLKGKTNVSDSNNINIKRAKELSFEWILKTIQKDKLPSDPNILRNKIVMLKNAFDQNDLTIFQWEKNDYLIKVAQTSTIILIQIQPTSSGYEPKTTKAARKLLARKTITDFLNSDVDIRIIEPTTSRIEHRTITPDIIDASIDKSDIQDYDDGIHSRCSRSDVRGDRYYNFWWRRVNWWTDGKIIDIYTLKVEGGAWAANYHASSLDSRWFEAP